VPKIFNQDFLNRYMFSFFTTNEANDALPDVIKKFEYALAKKNEITKLEQQLQTSLSTTDSFEEYVTLKQKLNSAITKFYESVETLENTGVVVKSIDQGLLDFPSKRLNATETRIGKLPSKGRIVVQKDKKMIMSDSAISFQHLGPNSDFSICTNSTEMIDNVFTLCSFLWDSSKPLKTLDVKNFVKKLN